MHGINMAIMAKNNEFSRLASLFHIQFANNFNLRYLEKFISQAFMLPKLVVKQQLQACM